MADFRAILFTDIEESTRRWETWPDEMERALRRHDALIREIARGAGGEIFKTLGDAFCIAFERTPDAVHAALDVQLALRGEDFSVLDGLPVRMAIHAGPVESRDGDYFGQTLNRVARLLAVGYGDQILLTMAAAEDVRLSLRAEATLRDLGSHRLKDLPFSERVYQAVVPEIDRHFAPLRSLDRYWSNVPVATTSFVGREHESARLATELATTRVLTIVGPGGVGKTRLAMRLGADVLGSYPDGVWFVELGEIGDKSLVPDAIAATLGARVGASAIDAIVHTMHGREALVILDDCEHVVDAVAEIVAAIARRCPGVRTVATSREALEIAGELVHRVDPLQCPPPHGALDVASARGYDAVVLFEDRARAALASFAITEANVASVVEIVNRLDGIALAIELAAPKVVALSPRQLAQRLDERFRLLSHGTRGALPRRQTLRALIDWSYDLLERAEQTLFRRLGVFVHGFTLEAACDLCTDLDGGCDDVFESLSKLVAKSLVVAEIHDEEPRYRLLESTHAYACERLRTSGECPELERRHAQYYAAYVARQRELWEALDDRAWQRRLVAELDNVRGALRWALVEGHDVTLALELLASIEQPRTIFLPAEALRWYETAFRALEGDVSARLRAAILRRYAAMNLHRKVPLGERIALARQALDASETLGDPVGVADAVQTLGFFLRLAGRSNEAKALFERAWIELERAPALARRVLFCSDWAVIALELGDLASAREHLRYCLENVRQGTMHFANAKHALGEIEFAAGRFEIARSVAREARLAFVDLELPLNRGMSASNLAAYALALDDLEGAREALVDALAVLEHAGNANYVNAVLEHHAVFASLVGDDECAARLLGYTDAHYVALEQQREPTEAIGHRRLVLRLEAAFDDARRSSLGAVGAAMSLEDALALAAEIQRRPTNRAIGISHAPDPIAVETSLER